MERVLHQRHVISGQEVHVSPYFPCLGILPPDFDSSAPFHALPPNITMECPPEVYLFIKQSKPLNEQVKFEYIYRP